MSAFKKIGPWTQVSSGQRLQRPRVHGSLVLCHGVCHQRIQVKVEKMSQDRSRTRQRSEKGGERKHRALPEGRRQCWFERACDEGFLFILFYQMDFWHTLLLVLDALSHVFDGFTSGCAKWKQHMFHLPDFGSTCGFQVATWSVGCWTWLCRSGLQRSSWLGGEWRAKHIRKMSSCTRPWSWCRTGNIFYGFETCASSMLSSGDGNVMALQAISVEDNGAPF